MTRVRVILSTAAWVVVTALVVPSVETANALQRTGPAASDFNGDGFEDLAVGVPLEDVGGITNAGAFHVLYGSSEGLQASSPDDQIWHQDSPGVMDTAEADDRYGDVLASGDFNTDGFSDLAVGIWTESVGFISTAGAVHVLYGSPGGLQASSPNDQLWHEDSPGVEESAEDGDLLGYSLAVGDFNTDGFVDLAIGVYGEDIMVPYEFDAGSVHVLHGSPEGLQALSPDDQVWHEDRDDVQGESISDDFFGHTLAVADFNGDGFDDLAVGVDKDIREIDAGAVHVLYGSSGGLQATSPDDQVWHQGVADVKEIPEQQDYFGRALATGDFNFDGFSDLAVGAFFERVRGTGFAGAAQVLYGTDSGLQASSPDDQLWHQDSRAVKDSAEGFDQFGRALSAGDFDGNGFDDLAVGIPGEILPGGGFDRVGAVHVLHGTGDGLQAFSPDDQLWHQDSSGVEDVAENEDEFGSYLSVRQFNDDEYADLVIGVGLEDVRQIANAGAAGVLHGGPDGLQTLSPDDQYWHQDVAGVRDLAEQGDQFACAANCYPRIPLGAKRAGASS